MSTLRQSHVVDLGSGDCNNVSGANEIVGVGENSGKNERKELDVAECRVDIVDLRLGKRDCRICYLSMDAGNQDCGCIELGCSCKDDLSVAHKQCAEAWFKIKGNKTCEVCGSTAKNVVGVNEAELKEHCNDESAAATASSESRSFWKGHRFLNFVLACMVFAFVISWLCHFDVQS